MTGLSPTQLERRFYSGRVTRSLKQREIDHFLANGVGPLDLAFPDILLAARVRFEPGGTFLLADELCDLSGAEAALLLLCRDDLGDAVDIAAWQPSTGRTATWLRRAWTIEEDIISDFSWSEERQLPVFRTPLEWLRGGRKGIMILDALRARWWIAYHGLALIAEDVPHGRVLRRQMTLPPPTILVSTNPISQVAA